MFSLKIDGRVARIAIGPPGKLNAIAIAHWRQLAELVGEAEDSDARVILLASSEPKIFSSGADVSEFEAMQAGEAERARLRLAMREGMERLVASALPSVALVEGACIGAAVALALACDVRVAGEGARFAVTPARLGLTYQAEDLARLIAAVGRGQAARLVFSADRIDAAEALRLGLVQLAGGADAADRLCAAIAAYSPQSVAGLKRLLAAAAEGRSDAETRRLFDEAFGSSDFAEGLAAFRERRPPDFA